jgi:pimeloyl-ACP methyl ester carboxylesterase
MGLRTNTYAQLAWGLAKQGISSFRYDKRVLPSRTGTVDLAQLTFDDFVTDVAAAATAVRGSAYSTMVLIGHSEGGNLAIQAVVQGLPVDGLVLLSTPGRPLTALLHEQIGRQVPDSTLVLQFDSALARYLRGEPTGEVLPALRPLLLPVNQRFLQTAAAFDPAVALGRVRVPTLIVQGETDIQVRVTDAEALQDARPDAELVLLPGTNHVLKAAPDTLMGTQAPTYLNAALPVVPGVVEAVRSFVSRLPAR